MIDPLAAASLARIDTWLAIHRRKVLVVLIVLASLLRVVAFCELHRSPVMESHEYPQMDMQFFDHWAQRIASKDALGTVPDHPLHYWHLQVAQSYHDKQVGTLGRQFEDLAVQEREAAAKKIWNKWYGGTRFHQEPLYPYLIAVLYKVWGSPCPRVVYVAQMLGGVLAVALLFLATRRLFGDLTALLAAGLAILWGPLVHYEVTLLRTPLISLAGIALLYFGQRMIDNREHAGAWHLVGLFSFGCLIGAATALMSTFLLFSGGLLVVWLWPFRRYAKKALLQATTVIAGVVLVLAPIWIRNHMVGAPLFSMTSVGAVTFAVTNVPGFVPSMGWFPYLFPDLVAKVMETCEGSMPRAVAASIAAHDSLAHYIALLFAKFAQVWHWYELPNNTIYYYTCLHSSVLAVSRYFVNALLILPAGLVGIAISLHQRRQVGTWLWYLACCLAPLVAFYVVSRLRVPLVLGLMPFAAFAIVQITDRVLARRFGMAAVPALAFAVLLGIMARPIDPPRPLVQAGAYLLPMRHYYLPRIERLGKGGDHAAALEVFESLLATRPAYIDELGLGRAIDNNDEAIMARDVFVVAYRMCAQAAAAAGQDQMARHCAEQVDRLQAAVQRFYEQHPGGK